jgi:hypothetical protein
MEKYVVELKSFIDGTDAQDRQISIFVDSPIPNRMHLGAHLWVTDIGFLLGVMWDYSGNLEEKYPLAFYQLESVPDIKEKICTRL